MWMPPRTREARLPSLPCKQEYAANIAAAKAACTANPLYPTLWQADMRRDQQIVTFAILVKFQPTRGGRLGKTAPPSWFIAGLPLYLFLTKTLGVLRVAAHVLGEALGL